MAEQPVFWLGGAPGKSRDKSREPPEAARYESVLREACETCGYVVDEYIAAQGAFGGWLVHLDRNGTRYRIFWSGKTKRLSFEQAHSGRGWNELDGADVADTGVANFVESVKGLLNRHDQASD